MEVPINSYSFSPDTTDAVITTSSPRKSSSAEMLDDSLSMEDENISFLPTEDKVQQTMSHIVEDHLPCPSQGTGSQSKHSSQQLSSSQSSTGSDKAWLSSKFSPVINVNKICPTFGKKKQSKPSSISSNNDRQMNEVKTPESSQIDDRSTKSLSVKSAENTAIESNIDDIPVDSTKEKKAKTSTSSTNKPSAKVGSKVDKLKLKEQREKEKEEKRLGKERCKEDKKLAIEKKKAEREQKKMEKDLKKMEKQGKKDKKKTKVDAAELNQKENECQQPDAENQQNESNIVDNQDSSTVMEADNGTPNSDRDMCVGSPNQESDVNQNSEQKDDESILQEENSTEMTITEQLPINDSNDTCSSDKESGGEQASSSNNSEKENCNTDNKPSVDGSPLPNSAESKKKQKKRKIFSPVRQKKSTKKAKVASKPSHVWVQCDRPSCLKWRLLRDITDPTVLPRKWYCSMNKDCNYNSCSISEEAASAIDDTVEFIYSPYNLGSLVWAKMEGYPWWPAMVDNDPDLECYYEPSSSSVTPVRYHVVFFDKPVSRGWIHSMNLQPLTEDSKLSDFNEVSLKYQKPLGVAFDQAHSALCLTAEERLKKVGFRALYRRSKKRRFDD